MKAISTTYFCCASRKLPPERQKAELTWAVGYTLTRFKWPSSDHFIVSPTHCHL